MFAKDFIKDNGLTPTKTQTFRIKAVKGYEILERAVTAGHLIPAKSNYSDESLIGWLFVFEICLIPFMSIEPDDLRYEGFPDTPTLQQFEIDWFNGLTDDQKQSSKFLAPNKAKVMRPAVLAKLKFHFIKSNIILPKLLKDLHEVWAARSGEPPIATCGTCKLAYEPTEGVKVCCNNVCGRTVHDNLRCCTEEDMCRLCAKLSSVLGEMPISDGTSSEITPEPPAPRPALVPLMHRIPRPALCPPLIG